MPNYKRHCKQNSVIMAVFIVISGLVSYSWMNIDTFFIPVGIALNTFILHSDLDQKRQGIFRIYGMLPHRSIWSHLPVLCTVIRNIYAFPVFLFAFQVLTIKQMMFLFAGQCVADGLHYVFDQEDTRTKITGRNFRRI